MRLISGLLLFCSLGCAEVIYGCFGSIAHIAAGGGIQTEFIVTNLGDQVANYQLFFYDDNGSPLTLMTDKGILNAYGEIVFPPHASRRIRTLGPANTTIQGYAGIGFTGNVGFSATFRVSVAPWAGSEAVVPVDNWRNNRFSLPFDHADSTTGLAMVNPLQNPIAVTLTFRDEGGGVIVADTFNMGAYTHKAIVATSSYPATVSKRGTIEISTTDSYMRVLGLRYGPTAISAVVPLVSGSWAVFDNTSAGCWDVFFPR
jgi:hypothetical protein